jgi:hypothetical protein
MNTNQPGKIAALPEPAGNHHAGFRCLKGVATGTKEKENVSQRNRLF